MQYRRDIDGLRAVAVGAVVLYHAGLPQFSGGYVGVDVFFVISGFLITSIIAEEIGQGRFSIVRFYERRTRRIFPALFAVLLFTAVAAACIMLPGAFSELGRSTISATLFVSNVFFWRHADYFDGLSHLKPLLHTWSLSVEEQFYIFFPPVMLLIQRRLGGRFVAWLAPVALLSLALASAGALLKPVPTFFLTPTRTWELLLGSLLALGALPATRSRPVREIEAAGGLGLIAWAVATFTDQTVFPGLNALFPCLGAGLVIHAGLGGATSDGQTSRGETWGARALGLRPVVFLGLISYSLYLWHWPLLAFARYWAGERLLPVEIAAVLALALAVSVASWKWIELPFRDRSVVRAPRRLFAGAAVAMGAALLFGGMAELGQGWPGRFDGYRPLEIASRGLLREGTCFIGPRQTAGDYAGLAHCRVGAGGGPRVLIWGDSFAAHLVPGLADIGADGPVIHQYTASGCPPILGLAVPRRSECRDFNDRAVDLIRELRPAVVVLSARWEAYLGRSVDEGRIAQTIAGVQDMGAKVVLVGQSPSFDFDNPYDFVYRKGAAVARSAPAEALNAGLARVGADLFLDPMPVFCSGRSCTIANGHGYLFFDNGHYTMQGSERLKPLLLRAIGQLSVPMPGGHAAAARAPATQSTGLQ